MGYAKTFTIKGEKEELKKKMRKLAEEYRKEAEIPGFRKGRAPVELILIRMGDALEEEALRKLAEEKIKREMERYSPFIYGAPRVENVKKSEEEYSFDLVLEVPPVDEIEIDPKKIKKGREAIEARIQEELKKLQEINAELKSVKRKSKGGDVVYLEIEGEGERIENWTCEIPKGKRKGFYREIAGLKAGEEKEIEAEFPEDFPIDSLRGKEGKVKIKVLDVKEKKLPELNDDFAKDMGFENLEELKKSLREQVMEEMKGHEDDIILSLAQQVDMDPPDSLVAGIMREGKPEEQAKLEAKGLMALDAYILKEKITVDDEELEKKIDEVADQAGVDRVSDDVVEILKIQILREKAIKKLTEEK